MEFKGSKREWEIARYNHRANIEIQIQSGAKLISRIVFSKEDFEENEANFKIMKAAPELLEACQEALRMYREIQPAGGWQGVEDGLISAINKALN